MDVWSDIGKKILDVGPDLAKAILGFIPGGQAASLAVDTIASAFGLKKGATAEEIAKALEADKDWQFKIAAANDAFKTRMAELEIQDRGSARTMQTAALAQSGWLAKNFVYAYAIGITFLAAFYIAFITFATIPKENIRFADTILGFLLGTLITTIVQFFYGTSFSSQVKNSALETKDRILEKIMTK